MIGRLLLELKLDGELEGELGMGPESKGVDEVTPLLEGVGTTLLLEPKRDEGEIEGDPGEIELGEGFGTTGVEAVVPLELTGGTWLLELTGDEDELEDDCPGTLGDFGPCVEVFKVEGRLKSGLLQELMPILLELLMALELDETVIDFETSSGSTSRRVFDDELPARTLICPSSTARSPLAEINLAPMPKKA